MTRHNDWTDRVQQWIEIDGNPIPSRADRQAANRRLRQHGHDTGFHDNNGDVAPWPDDIEHWQPDHHTATTPADPNEPPF